MDERSLLFLNCEFQLLDLNLTAGIVVDEVLLEFEDSFNGSVGGDDRARLLGRVRVCTLLTNLVRA